MVYKDITCVVMARLGSTRVKRKMVRPFAESCFLEIALKKLHTCDFLDSEKVEHLNGDGVKSVSIYGINHVAEVLFIVLKELVLMLCTFIRVTERGLVCILDIKLKETKRGFL